MLLWEQRDHPMYLSLEWNGKTHKMPIPWLSLEVPGPVVSRHLAPSAWPPDYDQTYGEQIQGAHD